MMMKHADEPEHLRAMLDAVIALRVSMKQFMQRKIKEGNYDLTYEMLHLMSVLWRHDKVNQQEIANILMKNKASITPLIDNLSKRNLVERTEDPNDRRNKIIALTKEGREHRKKFIPVLNEFYQRLENDISTEEMKGLTLVLGKMKQNLDL